MRAKSTGGSGPVPSSPPFLAGAAIGLAILGMASSAVALGAGLALALAGCPRKERFRPR